MNVRRLNRIAKILDAPQRKDMPRFYMGEWASGDGIYGINQLINRAKVKEVGCGTTCCIAGYATALFPTEANQDKTYAANGARILGLSHGVADRLFYGKFNKSVAERHAELSIIKREEAAAELRRLASSFQKERKAARDKGRKRGGKRKVAA